jgi:hypothetical protein
MKGAVRCLPWLTAVLLAGLFLFTCGCDSGPRSGEDDDSVIEVQAYGFEEGKGVFVGQETREAIGLATADVVVKRIPRTIRARARVFDAGKAVVVLDAAMAELLHAGQRVLLDGKREGRVSGIERVGDSGNLEVLVSFAGDALSVGAHVPAAVEIAAERELPSVPESSLLSTAAADFVFVANGGHFQRTEVKLAGRADGWVAVTDGLSDRGRVVTNGVRELWRIELQATKAGAACCAP